MREVNKRLDGMATILQVVAVGSTVGTMSLPAVQFEEQDAAALLAAFQFAADLLISRSELDAG
jgi:hypothetical protein